MAEMDAAAQAAMAEGMAAALRKFNTQLWTFYAFGVVVTILRTYSRIKAVGLKEFRPDDYIIWVSIVCVAEPIDMSITNRRPLHSCYTPHRRRWHILQSIMAREWPTTE